MKEQLEELKKAYATGVLRVRFGDHEVTYKSEAEMAHIIERLERRLGLGGAKIVPLAHKKGVF